MEILIWLSAKSRKFAAGRSVDIEPDFWDLESALDTILDAYGWPKGKSLALDSKKSEVMEYLVEMPAFIVLDDVDSLEGTGLEALTFFMFEVARRTRCKVLLTSRRVPFGMEALTTQVEGFSAMSADGTAFVQSRIDMFGLDSGQFSQKAIHSIIEACDGSPLFTVDLLRLCRLGESVRTAIDVWKTGDGEAARKYALEREYDALSEKARKVLLACALFEGSASVAEIAVAGALTHGYVRDAVDELQSLFLVAKPSFVEEEPRFDLSVNTRRLVLDVQGGSDLAKEVRNCIDAATGKLRDTPFQRKRIGQYIRQSNSLIQLRKHEQAEATLRAGLEAFPGTADLHCALGRLYRSWPPPLRFADARAQFARAAQLNCRKEECYVHWCQMEQQEGEWTRAAEAAEKGLALLTDSMRLGFLAGYCRLQLGKSLFNQGQTDRSEQECRQTARLLNGVLKDPEQTPTGQYPLRSQVLRTLVLMYERFAIIAAVPKKGRTKVMRDRFLQSLSETLKRWLEEHPHEPTARTEAERLVAKFPELAAPWDNPGAGP